MAKRYSKIRNITTEHILKYVAICVSYGRLDEAKHALESNDLASEKLEKAKGFIHELIKVKAIKESTLTWYENSPINWLQITPSTGFTRRRLPQSKSYGPSQAAFPISRSEKFPVKTYFHNFCLNSSL